MPRHILFPVWVLLFCTVGAASPAKVIVFPLDHPSSTPLRWLSEGIAESVTEQISGEMNTIGRRERNELVESLALPPGVRLSRASIIRVAQHAKAELVIIGSFEGTDRNLRIGLRILNVKSLKLSGEMVANGPLSALPQMENELAWLILSHAGLGKNSSREKFLEKTRKVSNTAYSYYIQSLDVEGEKEKMQLLLKAVQESRQFPAAQLMLGSLYFQKKECGPAVQHLSLVPSTGKSQLEVGFMLGTCHVQANQHMQAIQDFWRALQISRPYELLNNLGVAYLRKGDDALASNALVEAANLADNDATVALNLAIVRHLQGNPAAARPVLEAATGVHSKSGMLQFMLGVVLKSAGEHEKSSAAMDKAKSLGVNTEKLIVEDPRSWSRLILRMDGTD